jgi:HK97 family phage major capsid protein
VAITAPRTRADFAGFLTPEMSAPIFERAAKASVAMQLAQETPLGPNGKSIPVVTGRLTAGWVAEAARKPASEATLALKTMTPHKVAAIAVVSAEVVRANPGNYMQILRNQVGEAFAVAFDNAAFHDAGPDGTAGGGPFATYLDQSPHAVEMGSTSQAGGGIHGDFAAALGVLVADGKRLTGWALDNTLEPTLWAAVDINGRPLYIDLPTDDTSGTLARPAGCSTARRTWVTSWTARPSSATAATGSRPPGASWAASPTTCRPRPPSRSTARSCRCSRTTSSPCGPKPSTAGSSPTPTRS